MEITASTVGQWARVPAYAEALEKALGPGALARLEREAASHMSAFNRAARRLYDNFMALARRAVSG
jgi:hypothetical protein